MKTLLSTVLATIIMMFLPFTNFAQAPVLGTAADFVLFSTDGAVSNSGISQITGNVGTNIGSNTAFGNVNGQMHSQDLVTAQCSTDVQALYSELNSATPTLFPSPLLGNGATLTPGVYSISAAATLNLNLILDAQNNANAIFIFQINGPLSTGAGSKVILINGAQACNVFWKVEGLVSMAAGSTMRGTIIANNAAIEMNSGDTLEGRAIAIIGAITVDGVLAYTPIGCGSPVLTGPVAPELGVAACYAVFSSNGPVTNTGVSFITGDVGTNVGLTSGFDALNVDGVIHPIPDISTAEAAASLLVAYNNVNTYPEDIELLYPAQFGRNLVLTPHTYVMNGAVTFTDSLYLNAQGNADAVFVIKIYGAVTTSTYAKVLLINGTQAKNVYWMVNGSFDLNEYSIFNGTIIGNTSAISINSLATVNGRALTTGGAVTTAAITAVASPIPGDCATVGTEDIDVANGTSPVSIYPNPFSSKTYITINNQVLINNAEVRIFNILGTEIKRISILEQSTMVSLSEMQNGVYFYSVISDNQVIQNGKLILQ
ncbi:MAG: hypothetical protein A2W93_08120 [Bacteroidetes bacterium GWF2_43_63]|nr:MAG: hypothetical protein A2W94_04775 [Bacteroidetes bacterium GWE2_42_42]OFY55579.1 MAG: hypothetical protein A2W93_08120 [Bacteroidetes bacterium GWF2_43_63]HBG71593.1 hypothetical protein [Bacteroidales bacterium]HCB62126.1 hypothetical protein [Bacteroidales bacterium]HCY22354.1 hypothetical protein [Bacteroidales bacterium]